MHYPEHETAEQYKDHDIIIHIIKGFSRYDRKQQDFAAAKLGEVTVVSHLQDLQKEGGFWLCVSALPLQFGTADLSVIGRFSSGASDCA